MNKNGWDFGLLSKFEITAFFKSWIPQQLGNNSHGAITATRTLRQIVADIQMSGSSWAWSVHMVMIICSRSLWWAEHTWDQHQTLQRELFCVRPHQLQWQRDITSKGSATQLIPWSWNIIEKYIRRIYIRSNGIQSNWRNSSPVASSQSCPRGPSEWAPGTMGWWHISSHGHSLLPGLYSYNYLCQKNT